MLPLLSFRAVQPLPVSVRKPVVDISFGFNAELSHFESSLFETVAEVCIETALHIEE